MTANVQGVGISANGQPTGVNGCNVADWSQFTRGSIALVFGGGCRRRDVLLLAQDAGASAMVSMYGANENQVLQPTLVNLTVYPFRRLSSARSPVPLSLPPRNPGTRFASTFQSRCPIRRSRT